jgi:hypothetical protein
MSNKIKVAAEKGKAYLPVQEPPGATALTGTFPAQDTGKHERKQNEIADKCGDDTDSDVHDLTKHATASSPVPAGCGYN